MLGFRLNNLLELDGIVLQCHNNPDADTIASAFAVHEFLRSHGKDARIIYSGNAEITKANLLEMIISLQIPIEYVKTMHRVKTLVTVDCQHGERNVESFEADCIVVIDHHLQSHRSYDFGIVQSQLGACSTLVWELLVKEGFDFRQNPNVSTALYYGLFTDTSSLEEIAHPLDKDARDSLKFDAVIINRLRNNNLSLSELIIAGKALTRHNVDSRFNCAIFHAEPCDPNILGFISDLALQVSGIDVCVIYNSQSGGYKLSVRSCIVEVRSDEFVQFITGSVGSGGGHKTKAGGFISKSELDALGIPVEYFIEKRCSEYFSSYDIVRAGDYMPDTGRFGKYRKLKIPVGAVRSMALFNEETPMLIRTLEGDLLVEASEEVYLMIGLLGEVYPISKEKYELSYIPTQECVNTCLFNYSPTVKNNVTGESVDLMAFAKPCVSSGESYIYALPIARYTKVFTAWSTDSYVSGKPGDYLAARADDLGDVYVIRRDLFEMTYEKFD